MPKPYLVLISSLPAIRMDDGRIKVSKKFISGVQEHQKGWPGPVKIIMQASSVVGDNLDYVTATLEDLPFDLLVTDLKTPNFEDVIKEASLVMLMLDHRQFHLVHLCTNSSVPVVLTSEYTKTTRLQISSANNTYVLKRGLKRVLESFREYRARKAVKAASGIQCNGTPTYEQYRTINNNTLLFFDTRMKETMLPDVPSLHRRFSTREEFGIVRLAFSGRLNRMKGADHLIPIAKRLQELGKRFHLTICGDGELLSTIRRQISECNLDAQVTIKGVLDFETELVPFFKTQVDVFICCHRQGDPSCTYLETMSCGVPIIGYANEAFRGLASLSQIGWATTLDDPLELASKIVLLSNSDIDKESLRSLDFARNHTFELEFARRMSHARSLAREEL